MAGWCLRYPSAEFGYWGRVPSQTDVDGTKKGIWYGEGTDFPFGLKAAQMVAAFFIPKNWTLNGATLPDREPSAQSGGTVRQRDFIFEPLDYFGTGDTDGESIQYFGGPPWFDATSGLYYPAIIITTSDSTTNLGGGTRSGTATFFGVTAGLFKPSDGDDGGGGGGGGDVTIGAGPALDV